MESVRKLFETAIERYEKKDYPAAEKAIDELLRNQPDFERGEFLKAVILEETGRTVDAERHYEKSGNRHTLWFRLAAQLEQTDPERAIPYYKRVAERDQQNNMLWYSLGNLYERIGKAGEAKDCFRHLQPLREVFSRIVIPVGFLVVLITGGIAMVRKGDAALASVVFASAVFCLFWLRRDGGRAVDMIRKKSRSGRK